MSTEKSLHFIEQIIEENLASGFPQDKLRFRFSTGTKWLFTYWPR
jgi:glutaminyl-tRNA synthetase